MKDFFDFVQKNFVNCLLFAGLLIILDRAFLDDKITTTLQDLGDKIKMD